MRSFSKLFIKFSNFSFSLDDFPPWFDLSGRVSIEEKRKIVRKLSWTVGHLMIDSSLFLVCIPFHFSDDTLLWSISGVNSGHSQWCWSHKLSVKTELFLVDRVIRDRILFGYSCLRCHLGAGIGLDSQQRNPQKVIQKDWSICIWQLTTDCNWEARRMLE